MCVNLILKIVIVVPYVVVFFRMFFYKLRNFIHFWAR